MTEANRLPRHKSSLAKQFNDEVVSPVKKGHVKLDYNVNTKDYTSLTPGQNVEPMIRMSQEKKFAANFAKKATNYTLSSMKG